MRAQWKLSTLIPSVTLDQYVWAYTKLINIEVFELIRERN